MDYRANGPYPAIELEGKNPAYARAMLGNMGGHDSEISAVGLYFYNRTMSEDRAKEVSDAFHHISIVEMHHLGFFADLARKLGADPRLWQFGPGGHRYWSPGYITYCKDVGDMLRLSIKNEEKTIQKYETQLKWIKDPCICDVLGRIIEDELLHVKAFRSLLEED